MQRESCMGANECRKNERNDKLLVCRHKTAQGCSRVNEYREYERKYEREYELLACVSIVQREGCKCADEYRKYELLLCVSIIQRKGCMRVNEHTGASWWHM